MNILRIVTQIDETSAPYHHFSLPSASTHDITICTFFKSDVELPGRIKLIEGDNSLMGFMRAVNRILRPDKFDIVHLHNPAIGAVFIHLTAFRRKFRQISIFTVHNSFNSFKLRNKLFLLAVFVYYKRVIMCSQASFDSFPRIYKYLAGKKTRVIQNGVDLERVDKVINNSNNEYRDGRVSSIYVGRLIEIKDPFTILYAFERAAQTTDRLTFVGEGTSLKPLREKSDSLKLGKSVCFSGLVPRERVYTHLANSDLFLSASMGEGLPIAVLEAMACRCSVVLSDIPPHREIASGADFIPLVKPGDVEGFAREIRRFQKMDPAERKLIGEKCRQLVEERFSLQSMLDQYQKAYHEMIDSR